MGKESSWAYIYSSTRRPTFLKIIIPGNPIPQARMKHSSRGGFVKTYDPRAKEKSAIRFILSQYQQVEEAFLHPRICFLFHMPVPKGIRKRDQELYDSGILKHTKKPDVDNLVKLYLDCLDGIVIHGDQKVSLGACIKVYSSEPKTVIYINETTQNISPWEMEGLVILPS